MRSKIYLSIVTGLNVLLGFVSQVIVYDVVGPGWETDALVASAAIPHMIIGVFTVALAGVLIPIFSGETYSRQNEDAWAVAIILCVFFTLVAIALYLSSSYWVVWVFPGFNGTTYQLCVLLVKIQVISMVFMALNTVMYAVCYSRGKFIFFEIITLVSVIIGVVSVYFTVPIYGVTAAACIAVIRTVLVFAFSVYVIGKPTKLLNITEYTVVVWSRIKPLLASNAYLKSDVIVDRYLLSMSESGGLSLYSLAQQLYSSASKVIGNVLGVTALPKLSAYVKEKNIPGFLQLYRRRILMILSVTTLSYAIHLMVGEEILALVFSNGRVTGENLHILWLCLTYMGAFFIFGCIGVISTGAYYAIGNTKTPVLIITAVFTVFVVVRISAFQSYGLIGLCVAASAYNFTRVALELILFPKRLRTSMSNN